MANANSGLRLKPSRTPQESGSGSEPESESNRPTHTSYEFSLPYTTRRSSSPHRRPISPEPEPEPDIASSSLGDTMASHEINPVYEDDEEGLARRAQGLSGKYIDEFGNILDWNGTVLGAVHGDLPSMVGRPVSESGQILDAAGEMVGYVSDNYIDAQARGAQPPLPPRDMERGLKVDEQGNILDRNGEIVGKMIDRTKAGAGGGSGKGKESAQETRGGEAGERPSTSTSLSPSEVYLDVKSTHDGIQLIIKIPTVFNPHADSEN